MELRINRVRINRSRPVILLDGYDEYKRNNIYINEALTKSHLRNCWIVVTSRETEHLVKIKKYAVAEAQITGFDSNSVVEYVYKYLEDGHKAAKFLQQVSESKLIDDTYLLTGQDIDDTPERFGILHTPILLHMTCVLFIRKESLPKTRSGVISAIVDRCENWESIRNTGEKQMRTIKSPLLKLGKFVLKNLQEDASVQFFDKVNFQP